MLFRSFRTPAQGKAGIYVYQWKTGIFGAGMDVGFEIKGLPEVFLNTGEYCYFEVAQGAYEYKFRGGIFKQYFPVKFEVNQNYFFNAKISNFSDFVYLVRSQTEIDEAKNNILTERYELCTND